MTESERNKTIAKEFFAVLGSSQVERLESMMADDLQWIVPQDPEYSRLAGVRSKAQWAALYRGFLSSMPSGARYTIVGMTAEGNRVAVEAESHAETPRGTFRNRYHFLLELRDGLLVVVKEYADSLYMHMFAQRPVAAS